MYNTPPCFGVYLMGLVMKWGWSQGGLDGDRRGQRAQGRRSSTPRSIAPASTAAPREKDSRSRMNITFRLPSEELEKQVREGDRRRPASTASRAIARSAACARRSTTRSPKKASTRSSRSCSEFETEERLVVASRRSRLAVRAAARSGATAATALGHCGGARRRLVASRRRRRPARASAGACASAAELASMKPLPVLDDFRRVGRGSRARSAHPRTAPRCDQRALGPRRRSRGPCSRRCSASNWRSRSVSPPRDRQHPDLEERLGRPSRRRRRRRRRQSSLRHVLFVVVVLVVVRRRPERCARARHQAERHEQRAEQDRVRAATRAPTRTLRDRRRARRARPRQRLVFGARCSSASPVRAGGARPARGRSSRVARPQDLVVLLDHPRRRGVRQAVRDAWRWPRRSADRA